MKTKYFIPIMLSCLTIATTSCEKQPLDESSTEFTATRFTPTHLTKSQILKYTDDTYYKEWKYFICTDSLGKDCFWSYNGDCTFDPAVYENDKEYSWNTQNIMGRNGTLFMIHKDYIANYTSRLNPNADIKAVKLYWAYDEKTGSFEYNFFPFVDNYQYRQNPRKLISLDSEYIVIREPRPVEWRCPEDRYGYIVYKAWHDKEAVGKYYFTDADLTEFRMPE